MSEITIKVKFRSLVYERTGKEIEKVVYFPDANTQLIIIPDKKSRQAFEKKEDAINIALDEPIEISGVISERYVKAKKTITKEFEEWEKVE